MERHSSFTKPPQLTTGTRVINIDTEQTGYIQEVHRGIVFDPEDILTGNGYTVRPEGYSPDNGLKPLQVWTESQTVQFVFIKFP